MTHDDYFGGGVDPAPRTVVDTVNEGLSKRKRKRLRSVDCESRLVTWLSYLLDLLFWW
jgi:hypothetical protein